jgi:enamine deaminase RidA (YjgF/YER057c/UK114 family)
MSLAVQAAADETSPASVGKVTAAGIRRLGLPNDAASHAASLSPGQSAAVVVDDVPLVHTAQLLPISEGPGTATAGSATAGTTAAGTVIAGDASAQIARVYERLEQVLQSVGSSSAHIVKLNVYVANTAVATAVREDLAKRFSTAPPAVCFVQTTLPLAGAMVALDAVAATRPGKAATDGQAAITPAGPRVYVAGQAEKGDLRTATRKTLESLDATLKFLRVEWSDVAQVKSFVTPMASVQDADDETRRFFASRKAAVPPLVWVEWQSGLPIEIELVAAAGRGEPPAAKDTRPPDVEFLTPPGMTTPTIYSRVTRTPAGPTIFISGLYGVPQSSGGEQVERIFAQLKTILANAGGDFETLAKATYYVSDNDASVKLNELRPRYYNPKRPPAASKAQVAGVALPGATITLDMIAVPRPQR